MSASEGNEGAGDGGRPTQTPTQRRLAGISSYVIDNLEKQHPGIFVVKKRSELIKDRNPNVLDLGCIAHYTNLCLKDAKKIYHSR